MDLPFYAETSTFQIWTAVAFATASALLFSIKRRDWEYKSAALACLYVAFDERFMLHECIRLTYPSSRSLVGGDLTIFAIGLIGFVGAIWAIQKLSRNKFEKGLYLAAAFICCLEIYLDVFGKEIFYLESDTKIEEVAELLLALTLFLISFLAGLKWRAIVLIPVLVGMLFVFEQPIRAEIWNICPKLRMVR